MLKNNLFQWFETKVKFELQVAHTETRSFMILPEEMWLMLALKTRHTDILTNLDVGYPKPLKVKYQKQLEKFYSKCIFQRRLFASK